MSLTTEKYNVSNSQPFDSLGLFTYLRTYARRHNDEDPLSSVETWEECITRVVNSCNTQLNCGFTDTERQEFFDLLYNLKCSVAGRFLWQLGTRTVNKLGLMSLQNCAFTVIDEPVKPFTWIMNFLMLGAGCGYRISKEDVAKLPVVKGVEIIRRDEKDTDFIVPDTRQGWVKLLGKALKAHFYSGQSFSYSCHLLRSKGAPIKGFGGLASGPDELCKGIDQINIILNKKAGQKVSTVDCLDICNIIGRIVVSGNVRRCLPAGSLVQTETGLVAIENVKEGDMVATMKGYRKVLNNFYQGVQDLIEIKLMSGKSFVCTENHRVAVYENHNFNTYVWKLAKDVNTNTDFMINYTEVPENKKKNIIYYNNDNINDYKFKYYVQIDKVKEINFQYGNNYTYDIEVEEVHEFFCQGYLCHNSAQIALGDASDSEFMKAKRWDLGNIPNWRCYSNNSVICNDINEILDNEDFWSGYQGNGEPYGLINLNLCRKTGRIGDFQYKDETVEGVNPCSEQSLSRYETCCLADIFLPRVESYEQLVKSMRYLYRACKHSLSLPCADSAETENIVHNNFRMGIGVTGYLQATETQRAWLKPAYEELRKFDVEYSKIHNFPPSVKLCTTKPSGTLSLLGHCTPGVHPAFSQYMIRRIRVSSESKLVKLAEDHGYRTEYVKNFDGTLDYTTKVIEFPYSYPEGTILAENCSAIDQMEWVKRLQTDYSDNAVSVTVYYRKEELPAIKEWLKKNYNDNVKAISFLLHSEHGFVQAPLEKITKEQYDELIKNTRPINDVSTICYNSKIDENFIGEGECVGGVCPLK